MISLITVSGKSTRSLDLPTELPAGSGIAIYSGINPSPRTSSSEILQQSKACLRSYSFSIWSARLCAHGVLFP